MNTLISNIYTHFKTQTSRISLVKSRNEFHKHINLIHLNDNANQKYIFLDWFNIYLLFGKISNQFHLIDLGGM